MDLNELEKRVLEVEAKAKEAEEKRALEAKEAEEKRKAAEAEAEKRNAFYKGNHKMSNNTENRAWADFAKAMIEQRALSITNQGGTVDGTDTGRIAQINDLWDLVKQKEKLLEKVSYFYGPNFETQIPVLEVRPATPTQVGEGWSGNSPSATKNTNVAVKKISPITHVGILPITHECARLSFVGLEERIPQLLSESFRTAMCNMLFAGIFDKDNIFGGTAALSYVDTHKIETAAANAVSLADLDKLALEVLDTDSAEPVIVMNPDIYSALASSDPQGYQFLLEELVRNKTVEGIPVVLSGKAPKFYGTSSTLEAGDVAVFAGDLKNFAFGIAEEITIEPIRQLGDSNVYYQAIGGFNGIMVQPKNVWALVKKA